MKQYFNTHDEGYLRLLKVCFIHIYTQRLFKSRLHVCFKQTKQLQNTEKLEKWFTK